MRFLSLVPVFLSACSGSSGGMSKPSAQRPAPAVTAPVDPYAAKLNLGFEDLVDGKPALWATGVGGANSGITGYESGPDHVAHGGASSLRFHANGDGKFAASSVSTDATPLRGKRVRLHGWVKTDGVGAPGYAGVWLRTTRMVLWAHNGHVSNGLNGLKNLGHHLRERHGNDYVTFGFVFGEGSFQAIDWTKGHGEALIEHTLGAPPAWDVSAPFHATGKPFVVVDLRKAPRGLVADWFAAAHPMRETGAVFTSEANMSQPQALARRFDAIIYVDRTTRARPNPGGVRPKKKS